MPPKLRPFGLFHYAIIHHGPEKQLWLKDADLYVVVVPIGGDFIGGAMWLPDLDWVVENPRGSVMFLNPALEHRVTSTEGHRKSIVFMARKHMISKYCIIASPTLSTPEESATDSNPSIDSS